MERYDFDTPVNRLHTDSMKWDGYNVPGHDLIPLWVADMDFKTAPEIVEALVHRAAHGVFGYSFPSDEYYDAISSWFERRHHWHIDRDLFIPDHRSASRPCRRAACSHPTRGWRGGTNTCIQLLFFEHTQCRMPQYERSATFG